MKKLIWIRIKCFFGFHDWKSSHLLGDEYSSYGIIEDSCQNCKKKRQSKFDLEDWR